MLRPMTINELCEEMVVNLSLTAGNGFFLGTGKEKLWPERKLVVYDLHRGMPTCGSHLEISYLNTNHFKFVRMTKDPPK